MRRGAALAAAFLAASVGAGAATGVAAAGQAGQATPAAQAAQSGDFSLRPVRPAATAPRDRSYVVKTVQPGSQFTDRLEAVNLTGSPLDLDLAPVDAAIAADGSFAPGAERQAVGAWIDVAPRRVTVPPRGTVAVTVRVRVPADAPPGDHIAAVVAQKAQPPPGGGGVTLVQRVGVRVYLTVEGARGGAGVRAFEFRALRWVGAPNARVFEAEVANTGDLLVEPLGTFTLGRGGLRADSDLGVLGAVPAGEARSLRFTVPGELEPGAYDAVLRLHDVHGGPAQEQRLTFTVGTANRLAPAGDDGLPVVLLALAVAALAAAVALVLRRRRSDRQ